LVETPRERQRRQTYFPNSAADHSKLTGINRRQPGLLPVVAVTSREAAVNNRILQGGLVASVLLATTAAFAQQVMLKADLSGAQEVPPTMTQGKGSADITFDTASRQLSWTVVYSGLSGPATAAHFHGPAEAGKNAGVAVPIPNQGSSPVTGSATLTEAQANDLLAGKYYVNVHTAANPGGEIRGQVTK
jgi:hypothetical protein